MTRVITRHIRSFCPTCGKRLSASTATYEPMASPREGDVAFCIKCGEALRYGDDLSLRKMTGIEISLMPQTETYFWKAYTATEKTRQEYRLAKGPKQRRES